MILPAETVPPTWRLQRVPWDMLRKRRSIEELEELLTEDLETIKSCRGGS